MLKLTNITKTFNPGTITEKRAIRGVDLEIEDGDFITVIGGNGAGKSTLLNIIAGVHYTDSGSIFLDDIELTGRPEFERAKYLGRVFQDPMLGTAASMSIEENLAMAMRRGKRRGLSWYVKAEEKEIYRQKLALLDLGLEKRMNAKVGLLSGGQRQALTLLMSTLQKPKLLLLDEHTAALDPKTAKKVLELTEEFVSRDNLTAFMVTHNMKDAIRYGNRLIMMMDGKVVYDVRGEEKKNLKVEDLLAKFSVAGEMNDKMILS
ncbi:MAG: ABC transporter ATP-binding protein [Treponema sp.]|nr:ABC transporter ATP-binding protein [Treponema sp.]